MKNTLVTVIGGSGFIGSYIANELLKQGYFVQIISRNPENCRFLKTSASPGKLILTKGNIQNFDFLKKSLNESSAVINAVGLLFEKGCQNFDNIHIKSAKNIAQACKEKKIHRLIHISSLGVDLKTTSRYAATKLTAENEILKINPNTFIIRPGLVFGHEDKFFNKFASMASFSPFIPIIGSGETKFQPVYVGDVAKAVVELTNPTKEHEYQIFEIAGEKIYSFKELMKFILLQINKKRILVSLPFFIAKIISVLISWLPCKIITLDQIRLLENDNIIYFKKNIGYLKDLKIKPKNLEDIVPKYLERYK